MNSISKIAARWLKVSEEEAMNHLYEFQDHTHPPKQLTRDALSAALDDDSPYTSEECVQYLLEQIQREDSDSEEIDRMLSFLGHREKRAKLALDFTDFGSNHRFLISPEGELSAWDKASGGYGEALSEMEIADMEEADEDLLTDLKLNMGTDTYNMYKEQGYASGVSSSGSFCLLNTPELTPGQANTLLELVRNHGLKNVVLHEGGKKQFFSNSRELMNYLSPLANS